MVNLYADWPPIPVGGLAHFGVDNSVEVGLWSLSPGFLLSFPRFSLIFLYPLSLPLGSQALSQEPAELRLGGVHPSHWAGRGGLCCVFEREVEEPGPQVPFGHQVNL